MTEQELYNVEKILDRRIVNGRIEYKIKWENYPMSQCTWEPEKNLETVKELVDEYNNNHPMNSNTKETKPKKFQTQKTFINKKRKNSPKKEKTNENLENNSSTNNLNKNENNTNVQEVTINNLPPKENETQKETESKNVFKIDSNLKEVITVKMQGGKLMALVDQNEANGETTKNYISTEELRKKNPWILLNFYESKIKFT